MKEQLQTQEIRMKHYVAEIEELTLLLEQALNQNSNQHQQSNNVEENNKHNPYNWTTVVRKSPHHNPDLDDLGSRDVVTVSNSFSPLSGLEQNKPDSNLFQDQHPEKHYNCRSQRKKKRKVLILSDSHGKGMANNLDSKLDGDYQVTGFVKPNAGLMEVSKSVVELTADFTSEDCVIIIGGTNDIGSGNCMSEIDASLDKILPLSKNMNVILTAIPIRYDKQALNNAVCNANDYIYEKVHTYKNCQRNNINSLSESLNRLCYTKHGLHLNQRGKNLMCDGYAQLIKCFSCSNNRIVDQNNNANDEFKNFV